MSEPTQGLVVYRASRVEALLEPLLALLRAAPPKHALAPHEIIAAHPGMRRWLGRELALREGPQGVAANLRIELPSAWLDRLARDVLGEEAIALRPYRRELLRWRIHGLLDAIDDDALAAYLGGDAATRERRRFQLADRLARLYSQYLVYRPDWLRDWAEGRAGALSGGFLAPLWRALREAIGVPHRGERVAQLAAALEHADTIAAEPLHVFGLAHLAPAELAVFKAVAKRRMVVLYVPDPCRAHWGGLRSPLAQLREQVQTAPADESTESAFLEQGHPLLAAWGRMGQHFVLALDDIGASVDTRHFEDEAVHAPTTRLAGVQESIRRFDPALIGEYVQPPRADASLRVHACHTRLRELEVLRDALLDARSERPDLKPSDIVVMMPDIHAYLPLLPAVFGEAGRHHGPLPYHCADVAVARAHPLFEAFRRLLDLPQSRLTAPEIADLLATAPIAARLGLREGDVETIERWLERSRAAWALDGDFRARFGVPAIGEHTHAWAMDRLLAGYVFGRADETQPAVAVRLPDATEIAPLEGVNGPQAALLGALDRLLVELGEACADGASRRRASAWAQRLEQRIEALFFVAADDHDGREALSTLLQFVRGLRDEPADGGLDPELDFSVVREVLLARLDGVPERQRFLLGGVTFCGMVPQRAIPFEVVAVLGLNDGEFPRTARDGGLDLMARHPRLDDRDVRSDDRYLFLETLMSARWRLHLSYLGEGVRDGKPRNPAAPLAELMAALDEGGGIERIAPPNESDDARWLRLRPWWVRHPLQPFDARYFDGSDAALFSYSRAFARMRRDARVAQRPFVGRHGAIDAPAENTPIELAAVLGYFRDPARQLLTGALKLNLDALGEDRLREGEPLEARVDALDRVGARLFMELAARGERATPDNAPDWLRLSGALAPGRIGEQAWQEERDKVAVLLDAVADPAHPAQALFARALAPPRTLAFERVVAGHLLRGELREVFDTDAARWIVEVRPGKREGDLDFRDRIGLFLRWALLRLDTDATRAVRAALVVAPSPKASDRWSRRCNEWDAELLASDAPTRARLLGELERRIGGLVEFFLASRQRPLWYFPKTSWAALKDAPDAATQAWLGGDFLGGERDYAPGYAHLLAGERAFDDDDDYDELRAHAEHLRALIDLDAPASEAAP